VAELSVDGGNIRVRTPKGEACSWKGYKATVRHQQQKIASSFQENEVIVNWVNNQELAPVVTCLGDGHHGVLNKFVPLVLVPLSLQLNRLTVGLKYLERSGNLKMFLKY
jgi:hypothetical protein